MNMQVNPDLWKAQNKRLKVTSFPVEKFGDVKEVGI